VVHAHPRTEDIIQAFYDGSSTSGDDVRNVKADVLADKDPSFNTQQFLQRDPASAWRG